MRRLLSCVSSIVVTLTASAQAAPPADKPAAGEEIKFVMHRIGDFRSEACCVADFNNDGKLDIAAGPYVYLAPDWKPVKIRKLKGSVDKQGKGYYWDFANIPLDVDGDGLVDIVSCSWFEKKSMWFRNPGPQGGLWAEHPIEVGRRFELADIWDLEGKGKPTAVFPAVEETVWYEVGKLADGKRGLLQHVVSEKKFPWGVGVGDIAGHGRPDIVRPGAWYEAPADIRAGKWIEHPLALGGRNGKMEHTAQIWVYDVNGDGLNDIICSSAHGYGIFWYEQVRHGSQITWKQHVIDDTWTQAHSLTLADINGDGIPELITGKRFMAHNGSDTDENGALGLYYYSLKRGPNPVWTKHVISYNEGIGAGLNIVAVDLTGSGRVDLVTTGKFGGPVWFENKGPKTGSERLPAASGGDEIRVKDLVVKLSHEGEIVAATLGGREKALAARTRIGGCLPAGAVRAAKLASGGVEFTRPLRQAATGRTLRLTDRFTPAGDSLRWEIVVLSDGEPWTTEITTELDYPATAATRFWTAWSDPEHRANSWRDFQHRGDSWRDPLQCRPLAPGAWTFGGRVARGDFITVPLATLVEPADDAGLSIVFSPEDTILAGSQLTTSPSGAVSFSRVNHRLGGGKPVRFAMDLTAHEADWRGGLRWMVHRYPQYFDPPNPAADAMAGCGAYSGDENPIDAAKFQRMAFRTNWKLSDDFAYMGMFIPPVKDADEKWDRACDEKAPPNKPRWATCRRLNDYAQYMKRNGFYVLNYFNVTEFGRKMGGPPARKSGDPELWKDPRAFLTTQLPGAIHIGGNATCYEASVVDPGDPAFQKFILEQADRHIRWVPDAAGICIDRMDWLEQSNTQADDGVSWIDGKPARSLCVSWNRLLSRLGPKLHGADKVIFGNPYYSRLDMLRQVDGIYSEFGHDGRWLNSAALTGLRKPILAWTCNASLHEPDPDSFMQRHLYLGVYPTAPYPGNHHCITPEPAADKLYLDYGPLLDAMRGKKWVLAPHCVQCSDAEVKVNVFQVPRGYVVPVTFGKGPTAEVVLRDLSAVDRARIEAIQPGEPATVPIRSRFRDGTLRLTVPLKWGCAMVRITHS